MSGQDSSRWPHYFYSPEEMEELEEISRNFNSGPMAAYQKKWTELIAEVKSKLHLSPESPEAMKLAECWQQLLQEGFAGPEKLLARIGQAYQQGAIPREYSLFDPKILAFIKRAEEAAATKQSRKQEK